MCTRFVEVKIFRSSFFSQVSGSKLDLVGTFLHLPYIFEKPLKKKNNIILTKNILMTEKLLVRILNWVHRHFQNSYPLNNVQ